MLSPTMSECGVEPMQSAHSRCDVGPNPTYYELSLEQSRRTGARYVLCAFLVCVLMKRTRAGVGWGDDDESAAVRLLR